MDASDHRPAVSRQHCDNRALVFSILAGCQPGGGVAPPPRSEPAAPTIGRLGSGVAPQYACHPDGTIRLHYRNLEALALRVPTLLPMLFYSTAHRFLRQHSLRQRPIRQRRPDELVAGGVRIETRETRSYEASHINALWHANFLQNNVRVLDVSGLWQPPYLLAFIDDRSRFVSHAQWHLENLAHAVVHGLSSAFCQAGLPRSLMTDDRKVFIAAEVFCGLEKLSVLSRRTLPYSPKQ